MEQQSGDERSNRPVSMTLVDEGTTTLDEHRSGYLGCRYARNEERSVVPAKDVQNFDKVPVRPGGPKNWYVMSF